jgi:hypothetical protein
MEFIHSMNGKLFHLWWIGSAAFAKKLRQAGEPSAGISFQPFLCYLVYLVSMVCLVSLGSFV